MDFVLIVLGIIKKNVLRKSLYFFTFSVVSKEIADYEYNS